MGSRGVTANMKTIFDRADEFWALVDRRGPYECWNWKAGKISGGYGEWRIRNGYEYAHRLAFQLSSGRQAKRMVLHSCDNPSCCNPSHLREGSCKDNSRDMIGRHRMNFQKRPWQRKRGKDHNFSKNPKRGEAHNMAVLNIQQVKAIREMSRAGCTGRAIAKIFGVGPSQVSRIIKRRSWTCVD